MLTHNICMHSLNKGMQLHNHYRTIQEIYMTFENRFSKLSENSKRFLT